MAGTRKPGEKRGAREGERRGGRGKGSLNKTTVTRAAAILAAAEKISFSPRFSAYMRTFELADSYERELVMAEQENPQNPKKIDAARERLLEVLKILIPYEKPKLSTVKVQGDRDHPLFDLSGLSDQELTFLRRTVLKAQQVEEED